MIALYDLERKSSLIRSTIDGIVCKPLLVLFQGIRILAFLVLKKCCLLEPARWFNQQLQESYPELATRHHNTSHDDKHFKGVSTRLRNLKKHTPHNAGKGMLYSEGPNGSCSAAAPP